MSEYCENVCSESIKKLLDPEILKEINIAEGNVVSSGGKIYGKGFKGLAYDAQCIPKDTGTFCNEIERSTISIITLYGFLTSKKTINEQDKKNIESLLNSIKGNSDIILKKFYGKDSKNNFGNEIKAIEDLYSVYGEQLDTYTALTRLEMFSFKYIGFTVLINDETTYYVVNKKCGPTFDKRPQDLLEMIPNILDSFKILHKKGRFHCDIKPNNIIYDANDKNIQNNKKYKLIDWEKSMELTINSFSKGKPNPYGGVAYTSPICIWLHKKTQHNFFKIAIIKEMLEMGLSIGILRIFEYFNILDRCVVVPCNQIINKFLIESDKTKVDQALFDKYYKSFDLFSLGISILICVIGKKELTDQYMPFIETLINYTDPNFSLDIEQAIINWNDFIKKQTPQQNGGTNIQYMMKKYLHQ